MMIEQTAKTVLTIFFSMHFGSSVKAMRKASTHLTEGPGKGAESEGLGRV